MIATATIIELKVLETYNLSYRENTKYIEADAAITVTTA
jgi:hypothetical protein